MKDFFEKQGWHAICLALLLLAVIYGFRSESMQAGSLLGVSTQNWFWVSISIPIVHQVFVGLGWRAQLHFKWMTRLFGERDFQVFGVVFMILFVSRPIAAVLLAISNANTIDISTTMRVIISLALFIPTAYLGYSVAKYFGVKRAMGADHFDPSYRDLPMVTEGIFKYTSNAMYTFGFLMMWIPAFIWASKAALLSAAFSHLYIWVHYFTVEKPDMARIYGGRDIN